MTDYETLMKHRMEEFQRLAAQKRLVKQAELANTNTEKRNNFPLIANLVRVVSVMLASLR